MTSISSLSALSALTAQSTPRTQTGPVAKTPAQEAQPSSAVTLNQSSKAALTYPVPQPPVVPTSNAVWENASDQSKITELLANNAGATSLNDRFGGLGAALLERFQTDSGDFSQSVLYTSGAANPDDASAAAALQESQTLLHTGAPNQVTLDIATTDGAKVEITLSSQDNGLGVQIQVTGGSLSDADRRAIDGLADGFQKAVDGLDSSTPRIDLSGLTGFDTTVLSSVDLNASVQTAQGQKQTLAFHADATQRSLTASGPSGTINVSVDLSNQSILGTQQQHAQAVKSLLAQFDQEETRGHGSGGLMTMFEDAFSQLNDYGSSTSSAPAAPVSFSTTAPSAADRSVLSGLGDFSASITQTPVASNPAQPSQLDTFSYQVSQTTQVSGTSQLNRSVKQEQQSHLTASYHEPPPGETMQEAMQSQTYDYDKVDDSASSTIALAYKNGTIAQASLNKSAHQSTEVSEFVQGVLVSQTTTPDDATETMNLLSLMHSALHELDSTKPADRADAQQKLSEMNADATLQANPELLRQQHQ